MSEHPEPAQLARFDQVFADTRRYLDGLVAGHTAIVSEPNASREINVVGMCSYLEENLPAPHLAQLLAVAVDQLACIAAESEDAA